MEWMDVFAIIIAAQIGNACVFYMIIKRINKIDDALIRMEERFMRMDEKWERFFEKILIN